MWHEARRQEKLVRAKMVDNAKRNERRKQFYESVRREPEGFMQLHGQKMHIHVDPAAEATSESPISMRKWQGDPNVLIDRFDVRVYLDQIPEAAPKMSKKNILKDDVIELQCDYERYRILVFNEFRKVSEKQFLNEIAAKEFWPAHQQSNQLSDVSYYKREVEKKKKLASKRAAIAFNYGAPDNVQGGSTTSLQRERQQKHSSSGSSEDEDDFGEPEEIDIILDSNTLTAEQAAAVNKIGAHFNITSGTFLQLLALDHKEQTSTAQIKEIDKAKLALSGRHAKADRAVLKRKRALIIGNLGTATQSSEDATTTLLSFLAASNKDALNEDSSSSESAEEFVKTEFITSFGGEEGEKKPKTEAAEEATEEENVREAIVQGPILPNKEYRRLLELSRRRSNSPENEWGEPKRRRSKSRERRRGDMRDKERRDRRSSRSPRHRRTRSRSRSREWRRRSRSRSRGVVKKQIRRRRSSSTSLSPYANNKRPTISSSSVKKVIHHAEHERSSGRKHSKTRNSSSKSSSPSTPQGIRQSSHRLGNGGDYHQLPQPHKPTIGRKSRSATASLSSSDESSDSPLSIRSSMSDSERERMERENRKRRIRRTKRMVREQQQHAEANNGNRAEPLMTIAVTQEEAESRAERAAKKLRQQMHKALTKTATQLKEEEEQRLREQLKEKKKREEQLLEESRLLRKREREKRKTEDEQRETRRKEGGGRSEDSQQRSSRRRRRSSSDS